MNVSKKWLVLIVAICLMTFRSVAQDIIVKNNGEEIKSKVLEIDENNVKYKRFDNMEGPLYSVPKSEVMMIRYENGLQDIFNSPKTEPVKAVTPAPKPNQSAVVNNQNKSNPVKMYLAYTMGAYAPYGGSLGALTEGGGFMISFRFSASAFNELSIFEMSDMGGIDDNYWKFVYTGYNEYRRLSITGAYIQKLSGTLNGTSIHSYGGLGYGSSIYCYEYEKIGRSGGSYGNEMIKYTDVSIASIEFEAGLIIDFNGFNIHGGVSTCGFEKSMLTFGLGLSF